MDYISQTVTRTVGNRAGNKTGVEPPANMGRVLRALILLAILLAGCGSPVTTPVAEPPATPTTATDVTPTTQAATQPTDDAQPTEVAPVDMPAGTADVATPPAVPASADPPRVFLLDAAVLGRTRAKIAAGDHSYDAPLSALLRDANKGLNAGPYSVMQSTRVPPSGDQHDYVSLSRYYWPNPNTADGLPYVRRDGEVNPEIKQYPDEKNMNLMVDAVNSLALGYYFLADQRYADRAALLIRAWFLDEATRMNPNMNYGQITKGVDNGKERGVLDTRTLAEVIDDVGLLTGSKAWSPQDQQGMQGWFTAYLHWMQTSSIGIAESSRPNNHGSWYDTQAADFALFVGNTEFARRIVQDSLSKRIAQQIAPDGTQPDELARTKSWDYSLFNLSALARLAVLGQHVGVDVWNYQTPDGRSIRKALNYLVPFASGRKKWPYEQIVNFSYGDLIPVLYEAAAAYENSAYRDAVGQLVIPDGAGNRLNLLWPAS